MTARSGPHVAVIGAGPAGLAAARCLSRRGLAYTLLEQSAQPLASLRRVDPEMALLSPKRLSCLPDQRPVDADPTYLPFRLVVERFEDYRRRHGLEVTGDCDVRAVRREDGRFVIQALGPHGAARTFEASHVVNATGIIRHPRLPESFAPESCTFRWLHSLDARPADVAAVSRLLVVGGGASAAEVLDRWLERRRDGDRAFLSLRSQFLAVRNPLLGVDLHYIVWLPEQLRVRWLPAGVVDLPEPMNGIHVLPALRAGTIARRPAVTSYAGGRVAFEDGAELEPDLVVFATGFRYDVAHLHGLVDLDEEGRPIVRDCASTRTPRLYLLGARFGRTFASPYLRGIARDAAYVAERIAAGDAA